MGLRPSLRRRYHRRHSTDLNVTPFIDILVCLILFLLATAVLGKSAILNLYLPTEEENVAGAAAEPPGLIPTVAVTREGFILGKGGGAVERIPLKEGKHDYERLRGELVALRGLPEASTNIVILPEALLRYQILISTMDACREYRDAGGKWQPLFPVV